MLKKKIALIMGILMIFSIVASGCSSSGSGSSGGGGNTLIINDTAWDGVDLFQCSSWNDMQTLLADPVLQRDPETGETLPCIASESKWSEDGLTWTLTFPEGMYYSTGEQLEPEDFIASVEWGREVSEYASGYDNIESMEVSGRDVIVHLSEYRADMEYNFTSCFTGIIDKDELETMSKDELLWGAHPYGAYYVDEYSPGAYAILKANEQYVTHNPLVENKGACPIKEVKIVYTGEAFTLAEGVKKGDYDVLATLPAEYFDDLSKAEGITYVEASGASVGYAEINMTDPLFQDQNVRKAIVRGINHDNFASYLDAYDKPAYSLVLPKCMHYDPTVEEWYKENYGYNKEEAVRLLNEAGWTDTDGDGFVDKDGVKFSFTFSSRDTEVSKKLAQSMQADLKEIGIDMQITTQEWSYVNQAVNDGDFQMAFLNLGWSEPFLLMDLFCLRNPEATNPDPDLQMQMIEDARHTVDFDERTAKITDLQKHILSYDTIIPLVDGNGYRCWRSEIQGIVTEPKGGFWLNDVVVDENGNFRNVAA